MYSLVHICTYSTCTDAVKGTQTKATEALAPTHPPSILLFLSKQPQAQCMSMSAVWVDILSHKECVWRQMPPRPPPVRLPNTSQAKNVLVWPLWFKCGDLYFRETRGFFLKLLFLSTLALKEETGWRYKKKPTFKGYAKVGYVWKSRFHYSKETKSKVPCTQIDR